MNAEANPSHRWTWSFSVIIALLLYLLSWGPMTAHYWGVFYFMHTVPAAEFRPRWVAVLYAPLDWLVRHGGLSRDGEDYVEWCRWHLGLGPQGPSSKA